MAGKFIFKSFSDMQISIESAVAGFQITVAGIVQFNDGVATGSRSLRHS
jgi:hypothetical protein